MVEGTTTHSHDEMTGREIDPIPSPNTAMPSPETKSPRSRLSDIIYQYSSLLDESRGPLRTTADGNLIKEDSGDWLLLDTPPYDLEDRQLASKDTTKATKTPAIGLPESKNGATGFDDPRARKPLARLIKNKWTGSDRLFARDPEMASLSRPQVQRKAKDALASLGEKANLELLDEIRHVFGKEMIQFMGDNWYRHVQIDIAYWDEMLQAITEMDTDT